MGWWRRFSVYMNKRFDYTELAGRKIANIRRTVRANHPYRKEALPLEVLMIQNEIQTKNDEGGELAHFEALAIWEVAMKLYPEHITEADKPTLILY